MDRLSTLIAFIKDNRKLLISLFLSIAILSAIIDGVILLQRPQIFRSKASEKPLSSSIIEFISPSSQYKLSYDQKQWTTLTQPDETFGQRVVFRLNNEYGYARLDILEGKSDKDLEKLKDDVIAESKTKPESSEPVLFKDKPSYLLSYREKILGQDVYYYQQIVKENETFLIMEKRFPQLGNGRFYLDNLLQNLSSAPFSPLKQVKGAQESALNLTTVELVDLIRPSVVNIVHTYCIDIVNLKPDISWLPERQYNFCGLSKGSGFIVNEKGIIATNGHVAKTYPEEGLAANLLQGDNKMFATDLIRGIYSTAGQSISQNQIEDFYSRISSNPQYLDHLLAEIFKLLQSNAISISINYEKFYINVGNEPVKINYQKINQRDITNAVAPSSSTYIADLLDFNYPNKYSFDAIVNKKYQSGSDVALLQIKDPTALFPILELGETEDLKEGSDVVIAGYPVLVEGGESPQATVSYKTSTKPTVTRGIVSAVKQDTSGRKVFQTDASIDHGNSGGPAFNLSGQVIGIATFFFESQSGNFNFLRDILDLKELMTKNKIDNNFGDITVTWRKGLAEFRNQYYKTAIKHFNLVKNLSQSHPTVDEFIDSSTEAIKKGQSLEGLTGLIRSGKATNSLLLVFGSISIISFMTAGFLAVLPTFATIDNA